MTSATSAEYKIAAAPTIQCDILIVTVLHEEWLEFLATFPEATGGIRTIAEIFDGSAAKMTRFRVREYDCVAATLNSHSESKVQGKVPAAVFTAQLLARYSPTYIVNIGIAARVKTDCPLGGVVVARSLVDLGNCKIVEAGSDKFRFRRVNDDIPTDEAVRRQLVRIEAERSAPALLKWRTEVCDELAKHKSTDSSNELAVAHILGPIVSGDAVAKADGFRQIIQDANGDAQAYEMESYAIAQTAQLLDAVTHPKFIVLKGLSDNGDTAKNDFEKQNNGLMRSLACKHVFGLLRVAFETGAFGRSIQSGLVASIERKALSTITRAPDRFPFVERGDLRVDNLATLFDTNNSCAYELRLAVTKVAPDAFKNVFAAGVDEALSILNVAIESEYWQSAYWRVDDNALRLKKLIREACGNTHRFVEHSKELINRLLLEYDFPSAFATKTPIITCLVEDTGHHHALEKYKQTFEQTQKAAIDFDAKPLDELLSTSQTELFGRGGAYDLLFLYHTGVHKFFQKRTHLPDDDLKRLGDALIPAVERECCHVEGKESRVTVPVNANTMVLVANRDVLNRYRDAYYKYAGKPLDIPATWNDLESIIDFFNSLKDEPACGFLAQGKREGDILYYDWCNVAYGLRGGLFDKKQGWQSSLNRNVLIASPATIRATYLYRKLYNAGPDDVRPRDLDPNSHRERFASGGIAFAFMWSDLLHKFFLMRDADKHFSTHLIPGEVSMIGGGVCCLSDHTVNPEREIAQAFVRGLLSADIQATLTALGWCSGFDDVYSTEGVKSLPYAETVHASLRRGGYMAEAGPDAAMIRNLVGARLELMMRDNEDIEPTLKSLELLLRSRPWDRQ